MIDENTMLQALQKITALEQQSDSHERSIREIYGRVGNLETTSGRVDEKINTIIKTVEDSNKSLSTQIESVLKKVEEVKSLPGQRWNTVVTVLITTTVNIFISLIIGALIFVMSQQQVQKVTPTTSSAQVETVKK